ncbi:CLUMA_CG014475, isoform A, partial [Clunio marinus]
QVVFFCCSDHQAQNIINFFGKYIPNSLRKDSILHFLWKLDIFVRSLAPHNKIKKNEVNKT